MMDWSEISREIEAATLQRFSVINSRSVSGGDISDAYVLESPSRKFFVKLNQADRVDMFEAEFEGLHEIRKSNSIRVPLPICSSCTLNYSFLVLEFVEFSSSMDSHSQEILGRHVAKMHQYFGERFGWYRDNTIGSTKQINTQSDDWISFYRDHRLGFQLSLALQRGAGREFANVIDKLCSNVACFFSTHTPEPSLLHGDLWSGNHSFASNGEPLVFDPATYYGDREADIAMTELFGGYGTGFYEAYNDTYPLDCDYSVRKNLYNLYHVINHFNLFGGGYERQAIGIAKSLLAEI